MNTLSLTADKTKYIFFDKQRDKGSIPIRLPDFKINNVCLKRVKVLCYLQFLKNTKYIRIVLNHF